MSDTPLLPPEEARPLLSAITVLGRRVDYASIPPDITLKQDRIALKRPVLVGSVLVMVIFGLATFWLPLFNGLFAGALGGYHAGRMKRALGAAVVASVAVPAVLAAASFMSEQPSLMFLWGLSFWQWTALHVIGTLIGAVTGAASRPSETERELYAHA